ncbi:MAG: A/G-specific adenine glycosylase [Verrucomicrobiota bacterium]|jgi:A/G-specific adenine glycosylase
MADRTPQSEIRNPKFKRLVALLLDWFAQNARDLPWRRTRDPYAIWVSEIMLQQTQVKTVIPYWERWMRQLPTIGAVAKARSDKIHKLWEGLGYYTRARNLQKAARQIVDNCRRAEFHDAQNKIRDSQSSPLRFPEKYEDVLALPGIGRYTAGAICSIAFNQPTPILDGNVIRVLTRIFGIAENPREKKTNARLWRRAEELIKVAQASSLPVQTRRLRYINGNCSALNQSLMELGALVCTPRQPQCPVCPVKKLCVAFREGRVGELPNLGRRTTATARRFIAFVIERNGKFLVRQRPAGVVNAHLWEFPNFEVNGAKTAAHDVFQSEFGHRPPALQLFWTVKHSITRYRITLEAWHVKFGGASSARPHNKMGRRGTPPSETGVWKTPAQMNRFAFAAAHKTILNKLQSSGDDVGSTRLRRVVSGVAPETIGKQRLQPFAQSPTT